MNELHPRSETSLLAALGRIFWMMVGPLVLVLLAYNVMATGNGWTTSADLGYLTVLALLILIRGLEFRGSNPPKATGEPATIGDLKRYIVGVMLFGIMVWIAANLVGNGCFRS
jgi:hypothetical protein